MNGLNKKEVITELNDLYKQLGKHQREHEYAVSVKKADYLQITEPTLNSTTGFIHTLEMGQQFSAEQLAEWEVLRKEQYLRIDKKIINGEDPLAYLYMSLNDRLTYLESEEQEMGHNQTDDFVELKSPVYRTDFSNNDLWEHICEQASAPEPEFEFQADLEFIDNEIYKDLNSKELISQLPNDENITFIFIVDKTTISNKNHPILCVELFENSFKQFRVLPKDIWIPENNLSIANMDFEDFLT